MRDRGFRILELWCGVRIAVERKETPGGRSLRRELVVDVLPRGITVNLDGDVCDSRRLEHLIPVCGHARPRPVLSSARMAENVHARRLHGVDHAGRLVSGGLQRRMRRGHHQLELTELRALHIH